MKASHFTQADKVRDLIRELRETCKDKSFCDVVDDEGYQSPLSTARIARSVSQPIFIAVGTVGTTLGH